ncbi:hypothetical protein MD484_g436, partial [Candolleomyces efflorescens]
MKPFTTLFFMARRNTHSSSTSTPHIFIAGLGNAPYPKTRHSVGQYIVNSLSKQLSIPLRSVRGGHIGSGIDPSTGLKITLFKSKQLMNISGPTVVTNFRTTQLPVDKLVLVYDSLTHAPCKLSARLGGSHQGHNGVKSVLQCLGGGTKNKPFWQFRVGVGRGEDKEHLDKSVDAAEWVLGPLSIEEQQYWGPGGEGLENILREISKVTAEAKVQDESS